MKFLAVFLLWKTNSCLGSSNQYIVLYKRPMIGSDTGKDAYKEEENVYTSIYENMKNNVFTKQDKVVNKMRNGYIGILCDKTARIIENDPLVELVERDREVVINSIVDSKVPYFKVKDLFFESKNNEDEIILTQMNAPWGITRISDGEKYSFKSLYKYPSSAGEGVDVYIIDTGIEIDHPEFKGRAKWGINLIEKSPDTDENGHGTHCAGVIAGKNVGISKKANLIAVKALNKAGIGMISRLLLGIDYVIREHSKKIDEMSEITRKKFLNSVKIRNRNPKMFKKYRVPVEIDESEEYQFIKEINEADFQVIEKDKDKFLTSLEEYMNIEEIKPKTVVSMSVGGLRSKAMEFTIDYATMLGIHFSVAAGNDHEDACLYSPGSSKNALTVGASTQYDKIAFFSNLGSCVDLFAPGFEILSSWINKDYRVVSGTSMAAPHVTGVMALYLGENSYSPKQLYNRLIRDSYGVIEDEDAEITSFQEIWPISLLFDKENTNNFPLVSTKKLLGRVNKKKLQKVQK
ncbi:subtilisin-like proteinase [Hamiltosporidium magnivora]|uniref:Subtilisin-like proteinase n=1 Tax=Hamiltosporidium magnivora TaxID=148818 RepID=A0A4Q9LFC4_9MICR|nr:subtilisin-like proteinase [Hamiltosporidium magnivora]